MILTESVVWRREEGMGLILGSMRYREMKSGFLVEKGGTRAATRFNRRKLTL